MLARLRPADPLVVCAKLNRQGAQIFESVAPQIEGRELHPDLELLRLEEVLRLARDRLAGIIRMVPDPAVVKAAENLCAEAVAALGVYRAKAA